MQKIRTTAERGRCLKGQVTTSEKVSTQEKAEQTNVLKPENVSRETSEVTEIRFGELYRTFRANKLSPIESAYNAAYLYCNDKYYTSGAQLKERYRNIYAHPNTWFRHGGAMWRHNKWSAAVKLLELLPAAKRSADFTVEAAKPVKGKLRSALHNVEYSHMGIKALGRYLSKLCVFALCVLLFGTIAYSVHYRFNEKIPMLEVYVDGEYVGLSDSVVTVEQALRTFEESESMLLGRAFVLDCDLSYKPTVQSKSRLMQTAEINRVFRNVSLANMSEGYGLYVDDMLVCASPYKNWFDAAVDESLEMIKDNFRKNGIALDNVTYYNNMNIVSGLYPDSVFATNAEIRKLFSLPEETGSSAAAMAEGESVDISMTNAMPERNVADESALSDIGSNDGDAVTDANSTVLSVMVEKTQTAMEEIPFETIKAEDPDMVEGRTRVEKRGTNGSKRVVYSVGYLDGKEVMRVKLTEEIVSLPVPQTVLVGTRPMTEEEKRTMSTGTYIIPTTGLHTSGYGWRILGGRNEFHKGIDIASSYGTDIVAADGGEVIHARRDNSGYGLSIQILHDNGEITRYAHCSKVYVEEGQRVAQGELIAAMGSTGYVTGVHLHFEVLRDGKTQNPEQYFEY